MLYSDKSEDNYVYMVSGDGHRYEYAELIKGIFDFQIKISPPSLRLFINLLFARKLVIGTIDDSVVFSALLICGRALFHKPTVGFFLRPSSCYSTNIISKLKKFVVKHCNSNYGSIVSISSHISSGKYDSIVKLSVVDPQMWDLITTKSTFTLDPGFDAFINSIKGSRKLLSSIGRVCEEKGMDYIYDLVESFPEVLDHICIVIAGINGNYSTNKIRKMKSRGVHFFDRRISQNEMFTLYKQSDFVWCCYTDKYDQSSGVFGRALQFGVPVIVRLGSQLANYRSHKIGTIFAIDSSNIEELKSVVLSNRNKAHSIDSCQKNLTFSYRDDFVSKVNALLDVK